MTRSEEMAKAAGEMMPGSPERRAAARAAVAQKKKEDSAKPGPDMRFMEALEQQPGGDPFMAFILGAIEAERAVWNEVGAATDGQRDAAGEVLDNLVKRYQTGRALIMGESPRTASMTPAEVLTEVFMGRMSARESVPVLARVVPRLGGPVGEGE